MSGKFQAQSFSQADSFTRGLTGQLKYETSELHMPNLSTHDVVKEVGISRATLERWLASGKLKAPKTVRFGKSEFRSWTAIDVERVRKFKQQNYRKGRGRKPKLKPNAK
jgi:predicted DNA-binding transcriptional regulator AlpA